MQFKLGICVKQLHLSDRLIRYKSEVAVRIRATEEVLKHNKALQSKIKKFDVEDGGRRASYQGAPKPRKFRLASQIVSASNKEKDKDGINSGKKVESGEKEDFAKLKVRFDSFHFRQKFAQKKKIRSRGGKKYRTK